MPVEAIAPTSLDEVIEAGKPTLAIFTMVHCPPCKAMTPIIDNVAEDQVITNKVRIVRVPMERRRRADTAVFEEKYDVESYPTLHLYKSGELIATKIGYCQENTIKEFILKHLK